MARRRSKPKPLEIPIDVQTRQTLHELDPDYAQSVRSYHYGQCTVVAAYSNKSGWFMSISHQDRTPTWQEVRDARAAFVPANKKMALIMDPEYPQSLKTRFFHLWEVDRPAHSPIVDHLGRMIGRE